MVVDKFIYRDVAMGGVQNRNNILTDQEIVQELKRNRKDCYFTFFLFTEDMKKYVEEKKTVSGYRGVVSASCLPFDIDVEDGNLDRALQETRKLVTELMLTWGVNSDWMRYYFSGKKGFHVIIPVSVFQPEPSVKLPLVFRYMAVEITKEAGLNVDLKIYDMVRLFRISNTIHKGTGLYKIPLSWEEFRSWTIKEILSAAKKPRVAKWPVVDGQSDSLVQLYKKNVEKASKHRTFLQESILPGETIKLPRNRKLCYYKIMEGVPEGNRDDCAIRLTCYLREEGFSADLVAGFMLAWDKRNQPSLGEEIIERKITQAFSQVYHFGCTDIVLSNLCNEKCYLKQIVGKEIKPLPDWGEDYATYIESLEHSMVHLRLGRIDSDMRGIAPGEVAEIIGLPSVGKTMMAINILRQVCLTQRIPSIFFSLEQPGIQVFERAASMTTGQAGSWFEVAFREKTTTGRELVESVRRDFSEIFLCEATGITLGNIMELTRSTEKEWGKRVGFLVIDYLGLIGGAYGSSYEVITKISRDIKTMAKKLNIAVLFLHHVSVKKKIPKEPITIGDARDSSVAVDAVDFLLGMWRPRRKIMEIALLKNRKGPSGQREIFDFNETNLSIMPIAAPNKEDAKLLKEETTEEEVD